MYASNGSIPEIRVDERCKSYWKANMKYQNTSAVDSQSELKSRIQQQQQQHSLFSQASWGRLEMKPERNKFKVQAH